MRQSGDPTMALLCAAARPSLDEPGAARLRERARAPIDWARLPRLASRHGLEPLLHRHLAAHAADLVPSATAQAMEARYRAQAARNLQATSVLFRVLDDLARAGIEAVPYKGPALAAAVYGNLTLRQFLDLDVLVRPLDAERAHRVLDDAGWHPHFPLAGRRLAAHLRLSYVQLFTKEGEPALELHWGVAPRFFAVPLDVEAIWSRLGRLRLAGREVLAPAPTDLLLLLVVHATKDTWEKLEWVGAIAALVEQQAIDWADLLRRVVLLGAERMTLLALELARRLVGARLPEAVLARLPIEGAIGPLADAVERAILAGDLEGNAAVSLWDRTRFHLRVRERQRDRARYLTRLALTTTANDWAALRLPDALSFLYPAVRAVRLGHRYLLRASPRGDTDRGPLDPP